MACESWSEALALIGTAIELGALIWIARGVGLDAWLRRRAASTRVATHRAWIFVKSRLPWTKSPVKTGAATISGAATITASGSAELTASRRDAPPPNSLEEAGERLNKLEASLDSIRHEIDERASALGYDLRAEIRSAEGEMARRHDEVEKQISEESTKQVALKRTEVAWFGFGVFLQLAAAGLQLFSC